MCGICGVAVPPGGTDHPDRGMLTTMRDSMAHRGPDDAGLLVRPHVGLGHRRLSIVDVSSGRQPMVTQDGRFAVVYNGEIYNHLKLRKRLESRGAKFETRCDTEAVLHLCAQTWAGDISRLNGMFAFAAWDEGEQALLLARDRFGIKPLYYVHKEDGTLFFASEIKAFVAAGVIQPSLNHSSLSDFLANHTTTGEETLFEGVRRLPAGHVLHWKGGIIRIESYWDLPPRSPDSGTDDATLLERFEAALSGSVQARLMADVPLGVFLSGGIDSAAITSLMAEVRGPGISTFSVAFAEREANELHYARAVARRFRTEHSEIVVSPAEFFGALPSLIWHEDTPLAHPSSVPLHFVSKLAAEKVKVVLSGEGSDELLGGYGRYWKTLTNHRAGGAYGRVVPPPVRRWLSGRLAQLPPGRARDKLSRTFLALGGGLRELYFENFSVFSEIAQERLLARDSVAGLSSWDPFSGLMERLESRPDEDLLHQLLYADLKTYLHELLMKQDQMSMSASLESRVPFLDHEFAELAWQLPKRLKLRGRQTKYALRHVMRGRLPKEILARPKMGFPVPVGRWLRGDHRFLLGQFVSGPRTLERGLFDADEVRRLCGEHLAGATDHTSRLWALLTLEMWQRIFLDGEAPADVIRASQPMQMATTEV